jgi:hypothetical protein
LAPLVRRSPSTGSSCQDGFVGESADHLYERALAAADRDGRLPMPPVSEWETFPFDGEIRVRPLLPPAD